MMRSAVVLACLGLALGDWSVPIQHRIGEEYIIGPWTERGRIRLSSGGREALFSGPDVGSDFGRRLSDAAVKGDVYQVRAPQSMNDDSIGDDFVMSFTHACRLARADLSDLLTLSIDSSHSKIASLTVKPWILPGPEEDLISCEAELTRRNFNSTVRIIDLIEGPVPDTTAYVQKLEAEREERIRGGDTDNRSFIAKYWMYIVPVVIFLMLSNAVNPEGQGGGQ